MSVGFVLLAHDNLSAAGEFAHVLAAAGRTVAVHLDARAPTAEVAAFQAATRGDDIIHLTRRRCEWGMISLTEATLDGARTLLRERPSVDHVALVSGADLPLRPLAELEKYLATNPGVDLIEAVELSERRWVMDGLSDDRFRLYHPFNWRKQRGFFDANVALQRAFKIRRKLPTGLTPALGSQWWCLSRQTLSNILGDPQLPEIMKFFRWCWIPDESLVQSLVSRHSAKGASLSPTLSRFDSRGMPFVFYDDHDGLLKASDHFFARKIHPRANRLRADLLDTGLGPAKSRKFKGHAPEEEFARARRSRTHGREHLLSPARFPKVKGQKRLASAFPYTVIGGVGGETAELISRETTKRGDIVCHARLFAPGEVRLSDRADLAPGCVPATHQARDFWPDQYVINLARGAAGRAAAFCLSVEDRFAIGDYLATDSGARIIWFRGAWALDLYRRIGSLDAEGVAERAIAAAVAERGQLAAFRKAGAALTIRSASLLIDEPEAAVAEILAIANARVSRREIKPPDFAPPKWDRARPYLRRLQKSGCEVEASLLTEEAAP